MQQVNPNLLLLGSVRNDVDPKFFDEKTDIIHLVSRSELPGGPLGTPQIAERAAWEAAQEDDRRNNVFIYQPFPAIPMNGGGIYNSVGAQHLAPTRLPAITRDHDFYEVDCYDFKWIDQIRTDLKTRPAITFVSRGTKVRPDFIKNLQLTVKEFARPVGYNVDSRFGKSYLSKEDDLLSVLSFVDPRYVLPIFRTDKLDGMIFQYRLVSAKQAEGMHLVLFADMFVFLCDDPNKVLSVDGQKFEYGHFTQKDIIRYLLEFSTHDIVVKGKSDEKPKKKTKSAMKSEYIQYYSQTSTSSSTTTAS